MSNIERQLDSFIQDAAVQLKTPQSENKNPQNQYLNPSTTTSSNIQVLTSQNTNKIVPNLILLDQKNEKKIEPAKNFLSTTQPQIILMTSQPTQPTPMVLLPRNVEPSPVLSKIQSAPIKQIPSLVLNQFSKVHLTNALNMATPVVDTNNYNTRSNYRNKNSPILPKDMDFRSQQKPGEDLVKKKKVYNRVTPTIRAIYAQSDEKKQNEIQENSQNANKQISRIEENKNDLSRDSPDVHDEMPDIFDLPYVKSITGNKKSSDSSDISLEEIVVKNSDSKSSKKISRKSRKSPGGKIANLSDDDLDLWFSESKLNSNEVSSTSEPSSASSTRTLRSRTNSQRKML